MNEKLEEVVELIWKDIDGTNLRLRYSIRERQRKRSFVASWEGYVLQVAVGVGDMLARVTALDQPLTLLNVSAGLHRSVQAADRHRVTLLVAFPSRALHQRGLALCSVHRCT